ncbi:MAG: S8 family peptidase [Candidatus Methanofastidiosia archaeon]|jgi:subtilisin family serine protease
MKKKKTCISMSIVAIVLLALIAGGAQPSYNQEIFLQTAQPMDYVPDEAIVGFYGPLPYFYQEMPYIIADRYNLEIIDQNDDLCAVLYSNVNDETLSLLQQEEEIKYVQRNYIGEFAAIPNDPDWNDQWGPQRIHAPDAWDLTTSGTTVPIPIQSDVIVAVLDTGVDYNHSDLNDNYLKKGYDWVNDDNDPMDDNGHGTHCAGIIGAEGNNNSGIAGMIWQVNLLAEKIWDSTGWGTQWDCAYGIVHAVNNGADIINLSGGWFSDPDHFLEKAIQFAYNQNCLCVVCSHNDNSNLRFPARYPEAIAVGATNQNDMRCSWSNYGPELDIVAPGDNIYSTFLSGAYINSTCNDNDGDGYDYCSGTSMACPHVAGVAALMLTLNPDLTSEEIRCILQATAEDQIGDPTEDISGKDDYYGHGLVNAHEAVLAANFRYSIEVTPSAQVITVPGSVNFTVNVNLIQGTSQTVNLNLDSYYPSSPYTYSFSQNSGVPPFTSTLTVDASSPQLPKILRVIGSSDTAGCPIIRHSNFFTVSTEEPIGDLIWIKTSPQDDGVTLNPRLGDVWKSPSIWSDPEPPQIGKTNKLYVTVGNLDPNTDSGPVLVKPYYNEYPWTIPVKDWPSLGEKTIDNIPKGGSVDVSWNNWELPSGWPEHFCVFVQAWRPGYEDFDDTFDIQNNNNIAQKNFTGVKTSSPYTTTFTFENPTAKPMEITVYMEAPYTDWVVDLCIPSYEEEGVIIAPLVIPPKQQKDLELTINPGREGEGEVNIRYTIKGYEEIYPDLFRFTFHVKRCREADEEKKYLTGVYSTFNLHHDVVEMYVRVINDDYSNVIYDLEIFREDQHPMWDSIEVLETPEGWNYEDLGCGVKFYTETNPLLKCQRVRFVFRVTAKRISWYIRIHVTDKDHQNMGMIVGTRWWLYYYPV